MDSKLIALADRQRAKAEEEKAAGALMFMDLPDRWYDSPHWRCTNGHVSRHYLKSSVHDAVCLECFGPLTLTWPEDVETK